MRSRVRSAVRLLGALLIGVWTLSAAPASATDSWTTPFTGVRHLRRVTSGPRVIHVMVVDLCAAGISLEATRESERRATVPTWASNAGVDFAINGDFFSYTTYLPSGAAMGGGTAWGPNDHSGEGFVAFGTDQVYLSRDAEVMNPLPAWASYVVSGKPSILRAGEVVDQGTRELCTVRHPRTALGLSRDRQTLFMMVVDGRTSASIGMTCAEEAVLLRDLGAWDALNMDGGGSSTMWIRGSGVVNVPSDGSPRVVSNHLGVNANGSGAPGSCMPWEPEEDELNASALATSSSDFDGDGLADVCARAGAGIVCARSNGPAFDATFAGPALGDANGWSDPTNYETIAMGDVTGDGLSDICARANAGYYCWPSTGVGFDAALTMDELSDTGGWNVPEHYATIRLADFDGDGDDDVCARAYAGFRCWPSSATGFGVPTEALSALSNAAGFDAPSRWSTIRMGDIDGDDRLDACARTGEGFFCWRSNGAGFDATPIAGPAWSDASGWSAHRFYSTIRLADIDGDGRDDVCGRAQAGLRCHLSNGTGFGDAIAIDGLSDDAGYGTLSTYSTIRLADIDGDGDRDVCARGTDGIGCWAFDGASFGARVLGPVLTDENGWWRPFYYRTIRFADLDGDGDDDLCARASTGVLCWYAEGGVFGSSVPGPEWSDAHGWWPDRFSTTLRIAGPPREPAPPAMPDAGVPDEDAGGAEIDAGVHSDTDAGALPHGTLAGGCSAAPIGGAAPLWILIAAAVLLRRRR